MPGNIQFRCAVEGGHCCFCGNPMVNEAEEAPRHTVTVETTDGERLVLHYHEPCYQEWLGNREPRLTGIDRDPGPQSAVI